MTSQQHTDEATQSIDEIKAELRAELRAEMRAEFQRMGIDERATAVVEPSVDSDESSRRQLLRRGGLAVGAGLAAATAIGRPAAAADGFAILQGSTNIGTSSTIVETTGANATALHGSSSAGTGAGKGLSGSSAGPAGTGVDGRANSASGNTVGVFGSASSPDGLGVWGNNPVASGRTVGVFGRADSIDGTGVRGQVNRIPARTQSPTGGVVGTDDSSFGAGVNGDTKGSAGTGVFGSCDATGANGVWGKATAGTGVSGSSFFGIGGSFNGPLASLKLGQSGAAPTTRTDAHTSGEIYLDSANNLWLCMASGTPGTWTQLNGGTSSGTAGPTLRPVTPFRVHDSRFSGGALARGSSRVVSVKDAIDADTGKVTVADSVPVGATGIAFNLTITATVGAGFLALTPGDATKFSTASINWSASGQTIGNGSVAKVDGSRQVKLFAGGAPASSAQFIIDVTGIFS